MVAIARLFALAVVSLPALQAPEPGFVRWSAAELERRNAALSETIRPDGSARETLTDYEVGGSHRFRFIRRDADGFPEQHANIEDVVLIQSGAATLVVGGELVDRAGVDGEYRGTGIAGGVRYPVSRGDILHIPADTPHRYLVPEGGHVTYVLVRLPALTGERVVPPDAPALDFEPLGFACGAPASSTRGAPPSTSGSAPTGRPARPSPTTAARPGRTASATSTATPTGCPRSTTTSSIWSS